MSAIDEVLAKHPDTRQRMERQSLKQAALADGSASNSKRVADQSGQITSMQTVKVAASNRVEAIRLDSFDVIELHMLEPWLILGMGTTLYCGDNGIGKSAAALWTAARVTRGACWGELHEPANVLLLLTEDAAGIVRPKLEALGADMSRVYVVVCIQPGEAPTDGTTYLRLPKQGGELAKLVKANGIRLVILDALADCFEHPDTNKAENVAPVLTLLNRLSSKYGMAVIGIHHTNKNLMGGAKNAVRGSKAFTDKARQVVSFAKTDEGYGFQVTKTNFAEGKPAWRYTLESAPTSTPGKSVGIITTPVSDNDLDVDRIMRQSANLEDEQHSMDREVLDWLIEYLREGPAKFSDILAAAKKEGYSIAQLRNAQQRSSNPHIESIADPTHSGRGQRRIWQLPQ
ncbi:AAA family ATPase [Bifidobacterium aquikefiricola]|uniref:AAA family ATPase n=1 Tax=Bifidobacterium aquikefiricola TaxID=3059038 RepID=A0AB39U7U8_9BIFI